MFLSLFPNVNSADTIQEDQLVVHAGVVVNLVSHRFGQFSGLIHAAGGAALNRYGSVKDALVPAARAIVTYLV